MQPLLPPPSPTLDTLHSLEVPLHVKSRFRSLHCRPDIKTQPLSHSAPWLETHTASWVPWRSWSHSSTQGQSWWPLLAPRDRTRLDQGQQHCVLQTSAPTSQGLSCPSEHSGDIWPSETLYRLRPDHERKLREVAGNKPKSQETWAESTLGHRHHLTQDKSHSYQELLSPHQKAGIGPDRSLGLGEDQVCEGKSHR